MRDYLFRGKDEDTGKWVYGGIFAEPAPPVCMGERLPDKVWIVFPNPCFTPDWGLPYQMLRANVDPATVGEYTGQTDKNKKKIFEGDIVKVCLDPEIKIGVVERDWRIAGFIVKFPEGKCVTFLDIFQAKAHVQDKVWVEVIGNIHDKPEEGTKKAPD